ncbi:hypothetical protein CEXT_290931 [Caerostris extrusa]|uniref:Uncharacterized protein n=1 Tax=Caerostris extrusa TaxID=172846 RepID=A0AAV4W1F9_CAEEX|nr:hypothetical protein CEXT_290931 [Caerostris extrusa]
MRRSFFLAVANFSSRKVSNEIRAENEECNYFGIKLRGLHNTKLKGDRRLLPTPLSWKPKRIGENCSLLLKSRDSESHKIEHG